MKRCLSLFLCTFFIAALLSACGGKANETPNAAETQPASAKISVNGIQVPLTEPDTTDYQINGVSVLYKTANGWQYSLGETTSADNLSFDEARKGFVKALGGGEDGSDYRFCEAVRVADIIVYNESTTVVRGDFALDTGLSHPDVNNIVFHSSRFDQSIAPGDIALYYYGTEGWVIDRAVPKEGKLSGEYESGFTGVSDYNLIYSNRPAQFLEAYNSLGLTELPAVMWTTDDGRIVGFTYGGKAEAKVALALAIENAKAAIGADDPAIAEASAVLNSNLSSGMKLENAIYDLALAPGDGT